MPHETLSLWEKVITAKYGELDGWMTEEANNPYHVTVWRSIRNWWTILHNHTTISVGDVVMVIKPSSGKIGG